MLHHITVREFGVLGLDSGESTLDYSQIDDATWDWLKAMALSRLEGETEFVRLIIRQGQECLQVRNYVGVLESPSGVQIEILPKISESSAASVEHSRSLLWKMLTAVSNVKPKELDEAHLRTAKRPIIELLIRRFLDEVNTVVKRGIRNDYVRVSQQEKFLRGRLNVSKQLRQSPTQQHIFNVEYDKFIAERAENRLIRAALAKVLVWSKDHKNQRDGRELLFHFDSVTPSTNYREDFLQWRSSRDMIYYAPTKPWCQLILSEQSPFFSAGKWKGPSLLFPMEKLFESYIAKKISPKLGYDFTMTEQAQGKYLVKHESSQWFKLMPDMLITQYGKPYIVLDAKWKLLNDRNGDASKQYGLSQSDVYQLFAYGQKYLQGIGEMYLIYPANERFKVPLSPFDFSDDLRLWVVPFDLDNDQLMLRQDCHLPETFKEFEYLKSA